MSFFRDLPIKQKMSAAFLGTTTLALLAACGTFLAYERLTPAAAHVCRQILEGESEERWDAFRPDRFVDEAQRSTTDATHGRSV